MLVSMFFWFEERRAAEEFGKVSVGNRSKNDNLPFFDSVYDCQCGQAGRADVMV